MNVILKYLFKRINTVERKVRKMSEQLDVLTQEVSEIHAVVTNLDSTLDTAMQKIAELEAKNPGSELQPLIDSLKETIQEGKDEITKVTPA